MDNVLGICYNSIWYAFEGTLILRRLKNGKIKATSERNRAC